LEFLEFDVGRAPYPCGCVAGAEGELVIQIEISWVAGTDIQEAVREMVTLAERLQVLVYGIFNEVHLVATPGSMPSDVMKQWEQAKGR
jgi:hypothetical protein